MTNEQMKAGRFLKMQRGKRLFARMNVCWDMGGFVRIGTATRYSDYKPNCRALVWMGKSGSLYVKRGKANDCIDFCSIQFSV